MAYTAADLSGPVQLGDDKKIFFYDANDASDSLATVLASGFFNNSDDNIRFAVDDLIEVRTSAGQYMLQVTSSTGGAVATTLVRGDVPVETGATSAQLSGYGLSVLAPTTGAQRIYRLPAPTRAGQVKVLLATSGTKHTITSTGGFKFGSTGAAALSIVGNATLGAGVKLIARSTTQYLVAGMVEASTQGEISSS